MQDLEIFDEQYASIGIVDEYSSLIWNRKYFESGEFEIIAPATTNNISLLKTGHYIIKQTAPETGKILSYVITSDENGTETITAKGRFLSYCLHKRLIKKNFTFSGSVETTMRAIVYHTAIAGATGDNISDLILGTPAGISTTFSGAIAAYTDLYDALVALAYATGIAFRLRYDIDSGKRVFECYEANDRSVEQIVNDIVEFSENNDSIANAEYSSDDEALINCVTATYDGDFGSCAVTVNPSNASGEDKREARITGECITKKYYAIGNNGDVTELLEKVGKNTEFGWQISADLVNNHIVFDVVKGMDKTESQTERNRVIFAVDRKNVARLVRSVGMSSCKNAFYATKSGGSLEADAVTQLVITEDTMPSGVYRREMQLNVSCESTADIETYALKDAENYKAIDSFTVDVAGGEDYGTAYTLGDYVTIKSGSTVCDTQITAVQRTYSAGKTTLKLTFGNEKPKAMQKINKQLSNKL